MFARVDQCAAEGLQSCSLQGLPQSFCCEPDRNCMALAGSSTVMCCPKGSSCEAIRPITCDIEAQNPVTNLRAPIKTLAQTSKLPKCAANDSCCPFGFTCAEDGKLCLKDKDQSQPPEGYAAATSSHVSTVVPESTGARSSSATAAVETATEIAAGTAAGTTTGTAAAAEASQPAGHEGLGPGKTSIIGGAVGGAFALILLSVVIFLCVRSRKGDANSEKSFPYSQSSGSRLCGQNISAPIANPETAYRTDFIRKTPSTRSSRSGHQASRFSQTPQLGRAPPVDPRLSIPNPFNSPTSSDRSSTRSRYSAASDHYDQVVHTGQVGAKLKPIRTLTPSALRQSRRISIRDFADASSINGNGNHNAQSDAYRQTSFSAMMEEASMGDVHRGQPYVPGGIKRHVPGTTPRI
ncbi:hypothetical protein E4U22_007082 [Claviceps purpurea]|uniref:Mid2 domain-containing protein n=1 Tax=Claviceps purpurea (strain 20.1) TaxID=1111077 RepID=M1VYC1_CLAP2|nr:hypothetical protein E4U38_006915 [Claviceps purpurea]CCE33937.1 uncharacterized protein CPUR_07865 [Claviceps purpurea 20.1]KAG6133411.1 hypothetical protein E4U28_006182 [Claviceps purpurea]KAG6155079.1 hypothetical protein E4U37_001510 [Claviceps purpurea]KAG6164626.1 hypothetical protein E4U11_001041 [Claviceps purpurea]